METGQPHAWSVPGPALPRLTAPDLRDTSEPPWTVLLWDPRPARLEVVSHLIVACGAYLRCNDEVSAIPQVETPVVVPSPWSLWRPPPRPATSVWKRSAA